MVEVAEGVGVRVGELVVVWVKVVEKVLVGVEVSVFVAVDE